MPQSPARTVKPSAEPPHRKSKAPAKSKPKSSSANRSNHSHKPKSAPQPPPPPKLRLLSISAERKLDILGGFMGLIGLLSLLSLLSNQRSPLTGWWVTTLSNIAGWGAFVLPLVLITGGVWLVLRNIDRLPTVSVERLFGIFLFYTNLLAWMHIPFSGSLEAASQGKGGGFLGAIPVELLNKAVGVPGTIVVLLTWLFLAWIFTFDVSVPEVFERLRTAGLALRQRMRQQPGAPDSASPSAAAVPLSVTPAIAQGHKSGDLLTELPAEFRNMPAGSARAARSTPASAAPAAASTPPDASSPTPSEPDMEADEPVLPGLPPVAWELPKVEDILDPPMEFSIQSNQDAERASLIEATLTSFGAPGHVVETHRGPTVTQYGVEPDFIETRQGRIRVRVSKIAGLADDLALALAAPRIRIQAPVPGHSYVGIEVPNSEPAKVVMREVIESEAFQKLKSPLRFTIGKDVAGLSVGVDLAAMPHMLIAGTTGSGKSVCVNSILTCLLLNNTPQELRLILVDPKRVELTGYNGIPHLLAPVVVDAEKVIGALQWMQREMDARYHKFAQVGARNLQEYNARRPDKLPYLVAVIDELADLMMLAPDETERAISRLAQLARATGIHLILATQRPSVDVVTGLIKANFPARIAFAVASAIDSRVILDSPGAERLLGRGDMLFQAPDAPAAVRMQGVYVSDSEISRLVDYWRLASANLGTNRPAAPQNAAGMADTLPPGLPLKQAPLWDDEDDRKDDPMLKEAIDLVRREGRASTTMLQRKLRIGYTRAARMMDVMEDRKIIGAPLDNTQVREVLDYGPAGPPREKED